MPFDRGELVYAVVTPLLLHHMADLCPRDMVITCRGASGCGEHVLHLPTADPCGTHNWCSPKSLHMLRTQIYNEIILYIVPSSLSRCADERTATVLPNLGLRVCVVDQAILDRHKRVLMGLVAGANKGALMHRSLHHRGIVTGSATSSANALFKLRARRYMGILLQPEITPTILLPRVACPGPKRHRHI